MRGLGAALPRSASAGADGRDRGHQEQLPDGSERRQLLRGHRPVGRSVWQNAAICLPALTNPLHSPDTHIQTLFPSSPQGRKASVFGLAPLMKSGIAGVLLYTQESENRLTCRHSIYTLLFPYLWALLIPWLGFRDSDAGVRTHSPSPKMQKIGQRLLRYPWNIAFSLVVKLYRKVHMACLHTQITRSGWVFDSLGHIRKDGCVLGF